jgi:hypothetical protein
MCPLCVMSAILLAGSVSSACGINWLAGKHREKDENDDGLGSLSLLRDDCRWTDEQTASRKEALPTNR